MAISSVGSGTRRALVLILHPTAELSTMPVNSPQAHDAPHSEWKPQGLCAQWKHD